MHGFAIDKPHAPVLAAAAVAVVEVAAMVRVALLSFVFTLRCNSI